MRAVAGVVKTFFWLVKEELKEAKPLEILMGIAGFVISALFWLVLFNGFRK